MTPLSSLAPRRYASGQCMTCGWSGKWYDDYRFCPRCGKRLTRFKNEAAGWRAFHAEAKRSAAENGGGK